MRILYIANVSDLYGASRSLLRLAGQGARDGDEVHVILPGDGPLRAQLEASGVEVSVHQDLPVLTRRELRSPGGLLRFLRRIPQSAARLLREIRRLRPDVVHTNSAVVFTSALAARAAGRPHVWHVREFLAGVSPAWRAYEWLMFLLSSRIVCNSRAVAAQFHPAIRRRKVAVIYNGIPTEEVSAPSASQRAAFLERHGIADGYPIAGVAGRINLDQKGQDVFVRAAALLAERFPRAGFVIAGSPYPGNEAQEARLRRLIGELGLRDRITFTGEVADLACLYSALDICVLPARKPEGLGNVLLEAMALGKPVVGSAVGGIPEVIEHGENGYLAEPGDPESLARALNSLLVSPELRRRMGAQGRRRFEEQFIFAGCYGRIRAMYRSLQPATNGEARRAGEEGVPSSAWILGMRVDRTSYEEAAGQILSWAAAGESRYVCAASVNNVMEARDSPEFLRVMNEADLVTPDGMPLVWGLRRLGLRGASRVYGPDLTPAVLKAAEQAGLPVGFYGATRSVLEKLRAEVERRYPKLHAPYWFAPPFGPLSPEEDREVVDEMRKSGVRVLFSGLSTPKQERWMAAHRGRVPAVMLGVGAAFDFLAGVKPQAPGWMRASGTEWLFRLATEPRRLWRRYLKHNPRFAALFAAQLLRQRRAPSGGGRPGPPRAADPLNPRPAAG